MVNKMVRFKIPKSRVKDIIEKFGNIALIDEEDEYTIISVPEELRWKIYEYLLSKVEVFYVIERGYEGDWYFNPYTGEKFLKKRE